MFQIDAEDPTPLYVQLERAIRVAISTGRLALGARLPTVRQLAVELRINANTVARVYGDLERSGVVETRRGVGTFVAESANAHPAPKNGRHLAALGARYLADAAKLGFTAEDAIEILRTLPKRGD